MTNQQQILESLDAIDGGIRALDIEAGRLRSLIKPEPSPAKVQLAVNIHGNMDPSDYRWADRRTRHLIGRKPDGWQPETPQQMGESDADFKDRQARSMKRLRRQALDLTNMPGEEPCDLSSDFGFFLWANAVGVVRSGMRGGARLEVFNKRFSQGLRRGRIVLDESFSLHNMDWIETWAGAKRQAAKLHSGDGMSLTYGCLSTKRINPAMYVDLLAELGVTHTRAWVLEQWTAGDDPGTAMCPYEGRWGSWDLDRWSPRYWGRFQMFLRRCKEVGIRPMITILDWAGIRRGISDHWPRHPWNPRNLSHAVPAAPDSVVFDGNTYPDFFSFEDPFWTGIVEQLVRKVAQTCKGYDVELELFNEWRGSALHARLAHNKVRGWIESELGEG